MSFQHLDIPTLAEWLDAGSPRERPGPITGLADRPTVGGGVVGVGIDHQPDPLREVDRKVRRASSQQIALVEDGGGPDRIVGVTPAGVAYTFARNAESSSELAGAPFSPDGSTLFVNIQKPGITLAIEGPWSSA